MRDQKISGIVKGLMKVGLALLALTILFAPSAFAGWTSPNTIYNAKTRDYATVFTEDGNRILLLQANSNGGVYFSNPTLEALNYFSTAKSFNLTGQLAPSVEVATKGGTFCAVTSDPAARTLSIFKEGDINNSYAGNYWSVYSKTLAGKTVEADIAMDKYYRPHVIYTDGSEFGHIYYSGTGYVSEVLGTNSPFKSAKVVINRDNIYVVFAINRDVANILYCEKGEIQSDSSVNWDSPVMLDSSAYAYSNISAIVKDGYLHVAYKSSNASNEYIKYLRYSAESLTPDISPYTLASDNDPSTTLLNPSMAISNNNLIIAYNKFSGSTYTIYYKSSTDRGSSWSYIPSSIGSASSYPNNPKIAYDQNGTPYLFYTDGANYYLKCRVYDATSPEVTINSVIDANGTVSAYTKASSITVNYSVSDNIGNSTVEVYVNGSKVGYTTSRTSKSVDASAYNGQTVNLHLKALDYANNNATSEARTFMVDATAPSTILNASPIIYEIPSGKWRNGNIITLEVTDAASGVDKTYYRLDGAATAEYTSPLTLTDGAHDLYYHSVDKAGNTETVNYVEIKIDTAGPTTTLAPSPATPASGWYTGDVAVNLTADDGNGVGTQGIFYQLNNAPYRYYYGILNITAEGTNVLLAQALDNINLYGAVVSAEVKIDSSTPTIGTFRQTGTGSYPTIEVVVSDVYSGLSSMTIQVGTVTETIECSGNSYSGAYTLATWLEEDDYRTILTVTDVAGNTTSATIEIRVDVDSIVPVASEEINTPVASEEVNTPVASEEVNTPVASEEVNTPVASEEVNMPVASAISAVINLPTPLINGYTSSTPTVSWTASGDQAIASYRLYADSELIYFGSIASYTLIKSLSEGEHTLSLEAIDALGNVSTASASIKVDATGPAFSTGEIYSVSASSLIFNRVLFTDEKSGVKSWQITLWKYNADTGEWDYVDTASHTYDSGLASAYLTQTFSALQLGAYRFAAVLTDAVANSSVQTVECHVGEISNLTISAASTTINLGETLNLSALISAQLEDGAVITYSWNASGGTLTSAGSTATFLANVAGTYTITVDASALELSSQAAITITVSPIVDSVKITAAAASSASGATVTLTAAILGQLLAGETVDITSRVDTSQISWTASGGAITGSGTVAAFSASIDGTYTITASYQAKSSSSTILVNSSGPVIKATIDGKDLIDNSIISSTPNLSITINDNNGIDDSSITITVDNTEVSSSYLSINAAAAEQSVVTSYTVAFSSNFVLEEGSHSLTINAKDNSGMVSSITYSGLQVSNNVAISGVPMNYPNPFKPVSAQTTTLKYSLTAAGDIKLLLFDITGQQIWANFYPAGSEGGKAGANYVIYDGKNAFGSSLGNGVYHYFIINNGNVIGRGQIAVIN